MSDIPSATPYIPGYRITGNAGGGPFASQWEAIQESLDRPVEIAAMAFEFRGDAAKIARFEELGRTFARIRNHCFIPVIDISRTDDGLPYIVMEKVEGIRLSDIVRPGCPLSPERAAKIALQIATALDVAWKQFGFVHRNIKPRNVILGAADSVTIVNFLAGTFAGPGINSAQHDDGMLVGTPCYMAPEQVECRAGLDYHADIYGLGALLYQLLTGEAPFGTSENPMEVLELQKTGAITAPTDLNQSIPTVYSRLVQRMMEKNPEHRHPYWLDVAEDIQRVIAGRDIAVAGGAAWTPVNSTVKDVARVPAGARPSRKTVVAVGRPQASAASRAAAGNAPVAATPAAAAPAVPAAASVAPDRGRRPKPALLAASFFTMLALLAFVARLRISALERVCASPPAPVSAETESAAGSGAAETESFAVDEPSASEPAPATASEPEDEEEPAEAARDDSEASDSMRSDAPADAAVVQESSQDTSAPPPPQMSPDDRVFADVIDDLYGTLRSQPFAETKKHALFAIRKAAEQAPSHGAKFKALYSLFNEALPWEELVGNKLVDHPHEYDLRIGGGAYHVKPTGYVGGRLICSVLVNGQWILNRPLPLSDMKPDDMANTLAEFSTVSDSTPQLTSYALLLLHCGRGEEFASFVRRRNLTVFKPFMKYAGGGGR